MRSAELGDVASLAWGVPSFQTPAHIRENVEQLLETDPELGKYSLPAGLSELRERVAETHRQQTSIDVDPNENVVITAGNMEGLNALFHVLLDPGDEIIVTDPGFASHFQQIRLCGGRPVYWPLNEEDGWSLDPEKLPDLITPRAKAILLVSPSNPTGKIFSEAQLRRVGEIALERDLFILLDDPYHHFTFENRGSYFNLASVPDLKNNLAYLFTFSKAFAMSGWRVGYMIVPEVIKNEVLKVHDATMICTPRISQLAAIAALSSPLNHITDFERKIAARRDFICERLDRLPHVFDYQKPEGAYYIFPKIMAPHKNARQFSIDLLNTAKVCVTPGDAFGPSGEGHVRMAFCCDTAEIEKAFDRLDREFAS